MFEMQKVIEKNVYNELQAVCFIDVHFYRAKHWDEICVSMIAIHLL